MRRAVLGDGGAARNLGVRHRVRHAAERRPLKPYRRLLGVDVPRPDGRDAEDRGRMAAPEHKVRRILHRVRVPAADRPYPLDNEIRRQARRIAVRRSGNGRQRQALHRLRRRLPGADGAPLRRRGLHPAKPDGGGVPAWAQAGAGGVRQGVHRGNV